MKQSGQYVTPNHNSPASVLVPGASQGRKSAVDGSELPIRNASHERYDLAGWPFLDCRINLSNPIDWHADLKTKFRWDETFYADLPLYNIEGGADVKYPWELSRHQFFFQLAALGSFAPYFSPAVRVRYLWLDWIDQNPLYQGVNWTSGLEVGMRTISWIWTLAALEHWDGWQPGDLERISHSLVEHATYLKDHFSYYSSPYNHLIGEATALYLLSGTLADHPHAKKWRKQARNTLLKNTPKQFYTDGFGVEQGTSYHFYTLGFLTLAIIAARRCDRPLTEIEPIVHQAFQAAMPFRRPDGRWPAIGDLDSARAMPVRLDDIWSFDGLCNCAAVLFDDPELIPAGAEPGEELVWLFGSKGIEKWQLLNRQAKAPQDRYSSFSESRSSRASVNRVMADAGYVIAGDGYDWMLFDAGPIAAGLFPDSTPSTAHGHADTLQVLYFADGQMQLDDAGIPFYNGDPDWIRYFRSPKAHNTVEIEGVELVHPEGRLAWSREVKRPLLSADLSGDVWLCRGRVEWPCVTLERHVLGLPGQGLWIADWIKTDQPRQVTWYWQLPYTAAPRANHGAAWNGFDLRRASGGADTETDSELIHSQDDRPEGLRCHGYGRKTPGALLVQRQRVDDRLLVLTSVGRAVCPQVAVKLSGISVGAVSESRNPQIWQHAGCVWTQHGNE